MSDLLSLPDSPNAIFLQASACGALLCARQDGPTTDWCGRVPVRASLSARQAKELGLLTSGTFGPHGSISSASALLSQSLVSRLQTQMLGSILYKLIWKPWTTPSGRSRFRLRASVHRTSGTDYSGWQTPTACMSSSGRKISGYPNLLGEARLASWPTPSATDYKGGYAGGRIRNGKLSTDRLDVTAQLLLGQTPTGFPAVTENGGPLNPAHSRWLMGLPPEWDDCAPTGTPSSRKSPVK